MDAMEKEVVAVSGVFREVCSQDPSYQSTEDLWSGLKNGDEGAHVRFVFFLQMRKNEGTRGSMNKQLHHRGKGGFKF